MNVAELKAKAKLQSRLRATQPTRQTSSESVNNNQSEITEKPPAIYQVPNINVPGSMDECARLIEIELQKVSQSQSVLLSLWEKLQGQIADRDGVTFTRPVTVNSTLKAAGITSTSTLYVLYGGVPVGHVIHSYESNGTYISEYLFQCVTEDGAAQDGAWFSVDHGSTPGRQQSTISAYCKEFKVNGSPVSTAHDVETMRTKIYAELLALNPGIVIPDKPLNED